MLVAHSLNSKHLYNGSNNNYEPGMARHIINNPEKLGENLRRLRQYNELTLTSVAVQAGISKSYLSMIESGERPVHWSVLMRILHAQEETLCSFFSKAESVNPPEDRVRTRLEDVIVLEGEDPDENGRHNESSGQYTHILTPHHDGINTEVVNVFLPPHTSWSPDPISFPARVDAYSILGKPLLVLMGKTEYVANQGECLHYDASSSHLIRNYTDHPVRLVLMISPARF